MKIQIGEVYMDKVTEQKIPYPNKTMKYLLPCLKDYGSEFLDKLNNVFKVAAGIGDIITDNCGLIHEKHIFILLDSKIAPKFFLSFISWIKDQPMYEDDYVYGNIQKSTYHMIVLGFPEKYWNSLDSFKLGQYSKMYDEKTIKEFFSNYPESQKIFIKDHEYKIKFTKRVNKIFEADLKPSEWEGELDFPPTDKTDKFNHHLKRK